MVKGGGALERLASGRVMLFDKTGTLTLGKPVLPDILIAGDGVDADELLRLAASLDQVSPHVLASAIVTAANRRGLALDMPDEVAEEHGYGLRGRVGGHEVQLGKRSWVIPATPRPGPARHVVGRTWTARHRLRCRRRPACWRPAAGGHDPARRAENGRGLRDAGIERVVLVTGDRADIADTVGRIVGVDAVLADCDRSDKLAAVQAESAKRPPSWSVTVSTTPRRSPPPASASPSHPRRHSFVRNRRRRSDR